MLRLWARLTLLQRFTLASALIAVALAVGLSTATTRLVTAILVDREAHVAAESIVRAFGPTLAPEDLRGPLSADRKAVLDALFRASTHSPDLLRVRLWRADGLLLYSNADEPLGVAPVAADLRTPEGFRRFVRDRQRRERLSPDAALVFVPVQARAASPPLGAYEISYDLAPLYDRFAVLRRIIWSGVAGGLLLLYLSVFVLVRRASRQLLRQQADLIAAHLGTYQALARAIDARDAYTGDHSSRVARLAEALARAMGLDAGTVEEIAMAARLHDVGKIAVPDAVLGKPGRLTPEEHRLIRRHAEAGYQILQSAPLPEGVKRAVLHSHERWDGRGYPQGLAGEAIPVGARVLAVADAYEAMTHDRPYRRALTPAEARARIAAGAGAQFDPAVVEAFGRIIDAFDREAAEARPPQPAATLRDAVSLAALERRATPARVR